MKKILSVILCITMLMSLAAAFTSCTDNNAVETTAGKTEAPATTTTAKITTADDKKPDVTTVDDGGEEIPDSVMIISPDEQEWHYKVFLCPYSSTAQNGTYDAEQDEFEKFYVDHSWEHDAEDLPNGLIDEMKEWPTAVGPFGDADSGVEHTDIGWTDDNHGLMLYTTFTIDNLEEFKKNYANLEIWVWFDNTPTFYLNGKLIYHMDTEVTGNPADWVDGITFLDPEDMKFEDYFAEDITTANDIFNYLVEGENTLVVTLKDAWGGRKFDFEMSANND